jgi:hypothetical protein
MAAVPNAPGVPALLTGFASSLPYALMTNDLVSWVGIYPGPRWGIFRGGAAVVSADTVVSLDYKQEWVIADYPLERGAFETYDKVAMPYDARVRFVAGGSDSNKAALLASVAAIAGDYNLYDVVTPERTYTSCNVRHYDYHRTATKGLGMITIDVWLLQVRVANGNVANSTMSPSGATQVNGGSVQAVAPTSTQSVPGIAVIN